MGSPLEPLEEVYTLPLDFSSPELGENTFLLVNPHTQVELLLEPQKVNTGLKSVLGTAAGDRCPTELFS